MRLPLRAQNGSAGWSTCSPAGICSSNLRQPFLIPPLIQIVDNRSPLFSIATAATRAKSALGEDFDGEAIPLAENQRPGLTARRQFVLIASNSSALASSEIHRQVHIRLSS